MIKFIQYYKACKSFKDLKIGDTFWVNGSFVQIVDISKSDSGLCIYYKRNSADFHICKIYFYRDENSVPTDFHLELSEDSNSELIINRNGTIWISTSNPTHKNIVSLAKKAYLKVVKLLKEPPYPKLTKDVIFSKTGIVVSENSFELENLE